MSTVAKQAVIYLRVSTKEQAERGRDAEGFSIPAQRDACLRKAEVLGSSVVAEFVDRGESARSANRPELLEMLDYLAAHPTSYVIVHKIDRLARNRADDVEINLAIQKAGATLVSCSENIDETPSGILLHGIMSSIAEFYSRNLATEVKKGSLQKAMAGGTIGKAPTGYLNVRAIENGREVRTVKIDPVRGPIMQWVFETYAEGETNIRDLLAQANAKGLTSAPGPAKPSKPLVLSNLHRLLSHPYYKGVVRYLGVEYPGQHEPLVSEATWNQVQENLEIRGRAGEKVRKHHHFLKGTLYCGECQSRMIVSHNTGRHGSVYKYFICLGRQQKRTDCTKKAVLIDFVESKIEQEYARHELGADLLSKVQQMILHQLEIQQRESRTETVAIDVREQKLLDEQAKLLQAHYADAIPLDLLKSEQKRIGKALDGLITQRSTMQFETETVEENLARAIEFAADLTGSYRAAGPRLKRAMNQALFKRIYIDDDERTSSELREPFNVLLSTETTAAALKHAEALRSEPDALDRELEALYEQWLAERSSEETKTPAFAGRGLNIELLVGVEGLEPPTSSL